MPPPRNDLLIVEQRGWPLLFIRYPAVVTDETMRALVHAIDRAYDRRDRFVAVIDTSPVTKFPPAPARQVLTEWLGKPGRLEREQATTVGTAIVLPSSLGRALVAATNLARRQVTPQHWTKTLFESMEWARNRLIEAAVPRTPGFDTLYAELVARVPKARP